MYFRCDGSFEHSKQMLKLMDKKIFKIILGNFSLSKPMLILYSITDVQQAKLLEERYKTTIETSPPEFVKPLPTFKEIVPGEPTR